VHLTLIGNGDARDSLIELTESLGLNEYVEFSPHSYHVSELPPLIRRADAAIVANRDDVFTDGLLPAKLLEYVALGTPVIAARTSTIAEYFDDEMVRFFTPGDVDALAEAILELHNDRARLTRFAEKAERFNADHGWQDVASSYVATVRALSARTGSS
jgi:glycosyltransferase involved in cell wall biosynthesis